MHTQYFCIRREQTKWFYEQRIWQAEDIKAALSEPVVFSLIIIPQQACNLQRAASTVEIDFRPRISSSQMSLASLMLFLIVVSWWYNYSKNVLTNSQNTIICCYFICRNKIFGSVVPNVQRGVQVAYWGNIRHQVIQGLVLSNFGNYYSYWPMTICRLKLCAYLDLLPD